MTTKPILSRDQVSEFCHHYSHTSPKAHMAQEIFDSHEALRAQLAEAVRLLENFMSTVSKDECDQSGCLNREVRQFLSRANGGGEK